MRRRLVVIGIALALVGAALWYFPVQSVSTGPESDSGTVFIVGLDAPLDVLGAQIPFTLHWEARSPVSVKLYVCGDHPTCTNLGLGTYITGENGTSGTLHWNGFADQYFALVSTIADLTVNVQYPEPVIGGTLGVALIGFAGFLVVLGVLLRPPPTPVGRPTRRSKDEDVLGPDPL